MQKERIVIAEGDTQAASDLSKILVDLEYVVVGIASLGETTVQMVEELKPDLVLIEIRLKGKMGSIEAAKQIHDNMDIPVVFISTQADTMTLQTAMLAQAYGFVLKPFDTRELKSNITMALFKHSMNRKLRESEERYALAVRAANDGIWDWNLQTNEIYYSIRWKEILGFKDDQISNGTDEWFNRIHPDDQRIVQANLVSHLKGTSSHFECEYRIKHATGKYLWVLSRGMAVRDARNTPYRMAGSQSDITARKIAELRLAHDAVHDPLTGLPNRVLFLDRLQNRLERIKRNPSDLFAVMFLDLDRFKVVNDSLGHGVGDQLLITIANRLMHCIRNEDTVSRLSGDEFAILLNSIPDINEALQIANRIKAQLKTTTMLGAVERFPTASIGIALFNEKYTKADELLRDADAAMYVAKAQGGNQYRIFDATMHTNAVELIRLEAELKRAVEREEWVIHYQPIVSLTTNKAVGAEALVRWNHPHRGLLYPKDFIHIAEETGAIIPIGEHVLRSACAQVKIWRDSRHPDFWVSINLSARQFQDTELTKKVASILSATGLNSKALHLEITENVAILDMEYTNNLLTELDKLGVQTSLDDFGTGYSSLSYLKQFPLKILKIDQSFIRDIQSNKKNESLIMAIIAMARSIGLEVVAEGVEKGEQLEFLRNQLCDNVQGYLLSHPVSASDMTRLLED
ncbi:MAG: EAL domain-containing protein [Anaerolineales bacterium]|nr:EAL domain-containing protein [Anaerolineales bacterium]